MNNHYTGYELELNHSRQACIRSEFEHQARTKSLNEDTASPEALTQTHQKVGDFTKTRIAAGLVSLVCAILVAAYFILAHTSQVTALSNNAAPVRAGFGSNNGGVINQATTAPLAANTGNLLVVGAYSVRVVARDIPALLRFEEPGVNKYLGEWSVSLDDQGIFTASLNDQIMLQGHFEVTPDQMTFSSWSVNGNSLCSSDPEEMTGTYSYEPGEEGINLIMVSDKCYARSLVLSTHTLKVATPMQNPTTAA